MSGGDLYQFLFEIFIYVIMVKLLQQALVSFMSDHISSSMKLCIALYPEKYFIFTIFSQHYKVLHNFYGIYIALFSLFLLKIVFITASVVMKVSCPNSLFSIVSIFFTAGGAVVLFPNR